jgi:hypothetical protein
MMINQEAREKRDLLIQHYYDEFCHILAQLKFDKPIATLDDLNKEIERFGFLGNLPGILSYLSLILRKFQR